MSAEPVIKHTLNEKLALLREEDERIKAEIEEERRKMWAREAEEHNKRQARYDEERREKAIKRAKIYFVLALLRWFRRSYQNINCKVQLARFSENELQVLADKFYGDVVCEVRSHHALYARFLNFIHRDLPFMDDELVLIKAPLEYLISRFPESPHGTPAALYIFSYRITKETCKQEQWFPFELLKAKLEEEE